jgi:hypothetical protein
MSRSRQTSPVRGAAICRVLPTPRVPSVIDRPGIVEQHRTMVAAVMSGHERAS